MAPHGGCLCLSGSITWLQDYFQTCIYSSQELLGFYVGLLSIALWSVAQIPQFLENQANRSSDALSVWFLLQWLLGDSANLLGCLLTGTQQPTETYTAVYFILADLMMLGQYTYYALRDRLMQLPVYDTPPTTPNTPSANDNNNHNSSTSDGTDANDSPAGGSAGRPPRAPGSAARATAAYSVSALVAVATVRTLLQTTHANNSMTTLLADAPSPPPPNAPPSPPQPPPASAMCGYSNNPMWMQNTGVTLGWLSSVFYLCGRLSQLWMVLVERKGNAKGLSPWLFLIAVMANAAYGAAIILAANGDAVPTSQIPWVIGSLGTMGLDMLLLMLAVRARMENPTEAAGTSDDDKDEPLLRARDSASSFE